MEAIKNLGKKGMLECTAEILTSSQVIQAERALGDNLVQRSQRFC